MFGQPSGMIWNPDNFIIRLRHMVVYDIRRNDENPPHFTSAVLLNYLQLFQRTLIYGEKVFFKMLQTFLYCLSIILFKPGLGIGLGFIFQLTVSSQRRNQQSINFYCKVFPGAKFFHP